VLTEQVILDTLPPRAFRVLVSQRRPVFVCDPVGPAVGGTSRTAVEFRLRVTLQEAGAGGATFAIDGAGPPGPRDPALPANVVTNPANRIALRTRDGVGNISAPLPVTLPALATTLLVPRKLPFAFALDCAQPTPQAWNAVVRAA
jgi:hypothetical protein